MSDSTEAGPFGRAVQLYRAAGWLGTLPLGAEPGRKYPPPNGWTGHGAPFPSAADIAAWQETHGDRNIGLRLPPGVLGLDVDAYPGKRGAETLAGLITKNGPLPATWITTARTDGVSGIRLFRVPTELDGREINWPGEAGKHIEIVQTGHRYAVVWPSTNPEADGARYEWYAYDNEIIIDGPPVPGLDELAWLPEAWVRDLALAYDRTEKADMTGTQAGSYLERLRDGPRCNVVATVLARTVRELATVDGSRHESARDGLAAIVRLGGEGHRDVAAAVSELGGAFARAVGPERTANGEWSRLVTGAVRLAAADNPAPRQSCADDTLTPFAGPPGFDAASFTQPGTATVSATDAVPGPLTLPDEFWAARPSLSRIRQAAHSKVRSGDVVFYGLLCRLAAMAPHALRAETGVGTAASLNLFAAVVGPSGAGKSSGLSVSRELIKETNPIEEFPLGSGEGIAEAYMGEVEEPTGDMMRDGSAKTKRVRKQVRHNVLFHSDEGNTLNKLIERAGSTVGETLRSAWSGETIGQKNGRVETTRTVPARSYAAGLVIGYQPTTVLPLLDDAEAGTPQRFLFCWAVDASIPARSARVPWPGEMPSPFSADVPTNLPPPGAVVSVAVPDDLRPITFDEAITEELYDTEHAKNTGTLPADHPLRDPFRSQHPVLKVKVSAGLALLESRRHVDLEDWRLAQIVIDTSDAVRIHLQALAREAAGKARADFLSAEHETEAWRAQARQSVTAALELTAERRVAVRLAVRVHESGPATLGALRRATAGRDRPVLETALDVAVSSGWLVLGDDGRVHGGASMPSA